MQKTNNELYKNISIIILSCLIVLPFISLFFNISWLSCFFDINVLLKCSYGVYYYIATLVFIFANTILLKELVSENSQGSALILFEKELDLQSKRVDKIEEKINKNQRELQ